jgi:hypothetical protein
MAEDERVEAVKGLLADYVKHGLTNQGSSVDANKCRQEIRVLEFECTSKFVIQSLPPGPPASRVDFSGNGTRQSL